MMGGTGGEGHSGEGETGTDDEIIGNGGKNVGRGGDVGGTCGRSGCDMRLTRRGHTLDEGETYARRKCVDYMDEKGGYVGGINK